jgi:hypothetical protein
MASKVYVDRMLVHWGEDLLWDENHRVRKSSNQPPTLMLSVRRKSGSGTASEGMSERVRAHLAALVRKAPQVMVKITGGGADMKRIGAHIDYIARGGRYKDKEEQELQIETDDGQIIQGEAARKRLKDMFAHSGTPIPAEIQTPKSDTTLMKRQRREALNMILSMPHGIARQQVQAAASATVKELFGENHLYALVHHEDTDHQHTHVVIKMVGHDGTRLNPRKADLENWRIAFAKHLNARGIDAVATRRRVRLQRSKGESQAVRQMKDRGEEPLREHTAKTQDVAQMRALANEKQAKQAYTEMAKVLASSELADDRKLAQGLQGYLKQRGVQIRRSPGIR